MTAQPVRRQINGEWIGEPVILCNADALEAIRRGRLEQYPVRIEDDLLKIEVEGRTVIYRIMEKATTHYAYILRWPD